MVAEAEFGTNDPAQGGIMSLTRSAGTVPTTVLKDVNSICHEKKKPERLRSIRAFKLVAGAGFEPTIPLGRDYEPDEERGSPVIL
jgi:hypothetical protein